MKRYGLDSLGGPAALMAMAAVAAGKPVVVNISDALSDRTTAYWFDAGAQAHIFLRSQDECYYQVRALYHELAHIFFGHPACTALSSLSGPHDGLDGVVVRGRTLFAPGTVPMTEGDIEIEGEAEYLSSLLARILMRPTYAGEEQEFA